jgi:hypothetical protein
MMSPLWQCPRRVGFLFPHPCTRTTAVGCPDCQNGQIDDPYRSRSRYGFGDDYDYDYYDDSMLGFAAADIASQDPNFTEADGESLVTPDDDGFEDDLTAS